MTKRKELKIGDIRYLCGSITKVKVIRGVGGYKPNCLILEAGPQSKYTVGCKYNIPRRYLWLNCNRPEGVIKSYKKKMKNKKTIKALDLVLEIVKK